MTNYSCKAITGAAPRLFIFAWDSVTVTLIHTPTICLSFTLTPQSVCPLPPVLFCYELIQSFLITYRLSISSSHFLFLLSHLYKNKIWWCFGECRNTSCQQSDLQFLSAYTQPEGTGACWSAQQHEVGRGLVYHSLLALTSSHLLRHENVSSALRVTSARRGVKFFSYEKDTESKAQDVLDVYFAWTPHVGQHLPKKTASTC